MPIGKYPDNGKTVQMHIGNNIETPFSQNYNVHFCIRKFLEKSGYARQKQNFLAPFSARREPSMHAAENVTGL
jgi:hypothetical protein